MSLYGLRVCPVLSIPGFGFGCYYSATFITLTVVINYVLILIRETGKSWLPKEFLDKKYNIAIYVGSYAIGTVVALIVLRRMLTFNHLGEDSRAPEILFFASVLLSITQAYGLEWALTNNSTEGTTKSISLQRQWFSHIARMM